MKDRAARLRRSRYRQLGWLVSIVLVSSGLQAAPGRAQPATAGPVILNDAAGFGSWEGSFRDVAAGSEANLYNQPGICEQLGCRESTIEVALPRDVWTGRPGGVQIAIEWAPHQEDDLDLYVYGPDGSLVGRSTGVNSVGESVRLQDAANGRYRVVVVPQFVEGTVNFRGFGEVERDPAVDPVRPLLPNLVTSVKNPRMQTGAYVVDHHQSGTPSCYPERWPSGVPGGASGSTSR